MAHRVGRRDPFARGARRVLHAAARWVDARIAPRLPARPRGLALAATLMLAAGAVVLAIGPAAAAPAASASAPAASPAPVTAFTFDRLSGAAGIDPVDLIGKGVLVAALLYLTLRALRKLQGGPATGSHRLEVVETRPLGPKASLHLVAIGERRLVVGLSGSGIVALAELDAAELAEPAESPREARPARSEGPSPGEAGSLRVDLPVALAGAWTAIRRRIAGPAVPGVERVPIPIDSRGLDR